MKIDVCELRHDELYDVGLAHLLDFVLELEELEPIIFDDLQEGEPRIIAELVEVL
jgi:hypothetical protein